MEEKVTLERRAPIELLKPVYCGPKFPQTQYDLPCSDGEPMESHWHVLQMALLMVSLNFHWRDKQDCFIGGNMFVYFDPNQEKTHNFKGPDVFVALDVPRHERLSWVTWEEGKPPDVVIELLSLTTATKDKRPKKQVYQDLLKAPEYYWYNPRNGELAGFELRDGVYQRLQPDRKRRLLSPRLDLLLVRWRGVYQKKEARWLRWATPEGEILPTGEEAAQEAQQQAQVERQRAAVERERADRLAARLRALGLEE